MNLIGDMTDKEQAVFDTLTTEERENFIVVKNTANCARERLQRASRLPAKALEVIGNVVCKVELENRRKAGL